MAGLWQACVVKRHGSYTRTDEAHTQQSSFLTSQQQGLLNTDRTAHPSISDSVPPGKGPRICLSNKHPGDAGPAEAAQRECCSERALTGEAQATLTRIHPWRGSTSVKI